MQVYAGDQQQQLAHLCSKGASMTCSLSRLSVAANRDLPIDFVMEAEILNQKPSVPFSGRQWRRLLASIENRSYFLKWCNFTLNHVKTLVNRILFCQIALSSSGNSFYGQLVFKTIEFKLALCLGSNMY